MSGSKDMRVDVAISEQLEVGEGPHWDHLRQTLWLVDLTGSAVLRHDRAGGTVTRFDAGQEVGAAIPRASGGLVLAVRDGIAVTTDDGDEFQIKAPIEDGQPTNRMNDAKCDPAGRMFAGTTAFDFAPRAGALYRIEPDWTWALVAGEVTTSNGMAWSPDGTLMYFIDSAAQGVDVFDYDIASGSVGERRRLVSIAPDDGVPDGMTVDADGRLWVACFGGGAVRCYAPSGMTLEVIELPVSQVTSCAFGGPDLMDLYVTSAGYRLTRAQREAEPLAGATFVCRPGVSGLPAASFAG